MFKLRYVVIPYIVIGSIMCIYDFNNVVYFVWSPILLFIVLNLFVGNFSAKSERDTTEKKKPEVPYSTKTSSDNLFNWREGKQYVPSTGCWRDIYGNYYNAKGNPVVQPVDTSKGNKNEK